MKIINRRNIILMAGLILCIFLFIYTDARFTAYLIILFALAFIGALLCVFITGKDLAVDIKAPVQGTKGQISAADITVTNKSRIPVVMCNAEVTVQNMLTGQSDSETYSFCVRGRKSKKFRVKVKPEYCGCISVEVANVKVTDPFRLFSKKPDVSEPGMQQQARTYFMPAAIESLISADDVTAYNMESYKYSALSRGTDPAETFDIKNYEFGDSYKAIHWKLSSKMDELVIREFGLPIENNVLLLVDKNRDGVSPETADRDTEFAASLSYTLLKKEVNHTVGWYDSISKSFETGRVDSIDSFWESMKGLVSSPFRKDTMSAADRYIESDAEKEYSAYIIVSHAGDDIEKLMAYGQVDLYRPEDFR